MDETLFVPQYASTLQDVTCTYGTREVKRVPETEELCSEQNFKDTTHAVEMKDRMESELVKEHNCSFDRSYIYFVCDEFHIRPIIETMHLSGNISLFGTSDVSAVYEEI